MTSSTMSRMRRLSALLPAVLISATAAVAISSAPAEAVVSCSKVGTSLRVNQILSRGQCITSTNGRFTLAMGTDGNLVSFRNSDGRACFSSGTGGRRDAVAYVNPLAASSPEPLELNVVHQSDLHIGYIGFGGAAFGHAASTLNVSVNNNNGSVWVGYSEYYGINANARRIC